MHPLWRTDFHKTKRAHTVRCSHHAKGKENRAVEPREDAAEAAVPAADEAEVDARLLVFTCYSTCGPARRWFSRGGIYTPVTVRLRTDRGFYPVPLYPSTGPRARHVPAGSGCEVASRCRPAGDRHSCSLTLPVHGEEVTPLPERQAQTSAPMIRISGTESFP